ncbi:MAG: hypothetical protein K6F05_05870 [Succinivibrio sp.]|nr:hypothetical protein [Succinivibrio sp.]
MQAYFAYGTRELDYLKEHDPRLGLVITRLGKVERTVNPDLCAALIEQIIGQQISTKAFETVRARFYAKFPHPRAQDLAALDPQALQSIGISLRKAGYILSFCRKVADGELDLAALEALPDEEVINRLTALPGIGVWTAKMLLLFSLQRQDILCYEDLGIQRGMRMVYHHRAITPRLFLKYQKRLSPYGSVASFYFWQVSAGALEELKDPGQRS